MKIALMAEDPKDARAFFGWMYSSDCPFDVVDISRDDQADAVVLVEMTVTIDDEKAWFLQRAGAEWYRAKLAQIDEAAHRGINPEEVEL